LLFTVIFIWYYKDKILPAAAKAVRKPQRDQIKMIIIYLAFGDLQEKRCSRKMFGFFWYNFQTMLAT
jgi:hypothetical protein